MPASTSIRPRSSSKERTLVSLRVSTSTPSVAKACEPMAWRPPAMHRARLSAAASLSAERTPSRVSGWTMRLTQVAESCPCRSFTRMPSGFFCAQARAAGHIAPAAARRKKSRRLRIDPPFVLSHSRMGGCTPKSLTPATPAKNLLTRLMARTTSGTERAARRRNTGSRSPTAARRAIWRWRRTASC